MHNFHLKLTVDLEEKIRIVCGITRTRSLRYVLEMLFRREHSFFLRFIDIMIERGGLQSVFGECSVDYSVKIYESVHQTLKLYHKSLDTFSIAVLFRDIINFICDYIISYGVERWFDFLEVVLSENEEFVRQEVCHLREKFEVNSNLLTHMLIQGLRGIGKILFFDENGVFSSQIRLL